MREPKYKRQGFILTAYMKFRKTPDCWVTLPFGIYVPRKAWDSGEWKGDRYKRVRLHEETHFGRVWSRPYLSALWWPLHYMIDLSIVLDEEVVAFRVEISDMPDDEKLSWAKWFAETLIIDYGIKHKTIEEIVSLILQK